VPVAEAVTAIKEKLAEITLNEQRKAGLVK
jgi:hypothetical protein